MSVPPAETKSWPSRMVPLSNPPPSIVSKPPELIVVAFAVPPDSTTIVPPLSTISPEST
jgi:hypothetical protein